MIQMNPMLQQMSQANPMVAQMLSNPEMMRQSVQMVQVGPVASSNQITMPKPTSHFSFT
jgi:hypothetical protein